MSRKGMSPALTLIMSASVLMMAAFTVIFIVTGQFGSFGDFADRETSGAECSLWSETGQCDKFDDADCSGTCESDDESQSTGSISSSDNGPDCESITTQSNCRRAGVCLWFSGRCKFHESTHPSPSYKEHEVIGGGQPYVQKLKSGDRKTFCDSSSGDRVVQEESLDGLRNALDKAGSGDVVYIPGNMQIDIEFNTRLQIPAGVTLASNRGCNGDEGALITTGMKQQDSWVGADELLPADNTRLTGVRLEGPYGERGFFEFRNDYTHGINSGGSSNVEIDNVEVYGFPYGISGENLHIHHSNIHHNSEEGLGYGVAATNTGSVIEYNYMDYNRHHIAGSGDGAEGYIFRYNVIGSHGMIHSIDMHPPGGDKMKIYKNTVKFDGNANVRIRGVPEQVAEVHHNWFYQSMKPCAGDGHCAINQREVSEFTKLDFWENSYGKEEPSCDIGAPRESCS